MGFEGEFASYEPLRRLLDSEKVKALQKRFKIRIREEETKEFEESILRKDQVEESNLKPDLILAIDGSNIVAKAENGYPGAEFGYITVAAVLIDLKKVEELENHDFINPKEFRKTEKPSTIESVFPGCNVILDKGKSAKASLRRRLFEELEDNRIFQDGETLLETYEYLFDIKRTLFQGEHLP